MFGSAKQEQIAAFRAEVSSLQERLAADIANLSGQDAFCQQALSDASERCNAAGGVLSSASTLGELQVARRIVVEGLTATRLVRDKQGLPLGPDLPELSTQTVGQPTALVHDGDEHVAYPAYHPDRPHFFGGGMIGGTAAPAGYYRTRSGRRPPRSAGAWLPAMSSATR